ncbi:Uncharacterised protein [Porphyromonas macacae]|uniref:Uncharacterized protein n=2 Tax=Porphyromonas macacae TaxID=28115 RepID=A0A379E8X6_9PORP|nr:hypothetical protein [Porphyromonas macacae]SUB89147.1 Uncharacterised protein [Porphyromonas macacae]
MVTSVIGKIFLQAYNEKNGTNYTPKEFFLKIYYPLFFGHEKYLMTAGNSPFENPKISWKEMILGKKPFETAEKRTERLSKFIKKIDSGVGDASIAIGFPSIDPLSTTSGQISIPRNQVDPSESYLSWIGAGLGVGVQGGMTILLNKPELLMDIFEGWKIYRQLLDKSPIMRGNQIHTWNGKWLNKHYDTIDKSLDFSGVFSTKDGIMEIDVLPWAQLLVAISRHFQDPKMMGYVYNIGQTNTTIGFIPFVLQPIRKANELYVRYFGIDRNRDAMKLFGTAMGFSKACSEGSIGLKAMEPKGLSEFMKKGKIPVYKLDDKERIIQFNTYQIWLLAMLNNEKLWEKAKEFACSLQAFGSGGKVGRTGRTNMIKQLLEATNKKNFIEQLTEIVGESESSNEFEEMASILHLMPTDNVPYFLTLLRFHYAVINKH